MANFQLIRINDYTCEIPHKKIQKWKQIKDPFIVIWKISKLQDQMIPQIPNWHKFNPRWTNVKNRSKFQWPDFSYEIRGKCVFRWLVVIRNNVCFGYIISVFSTVFRTRLVIEWEVISCGLMVEPVVDL